MCCSIAGRTGRMVSGWYVDNLRFRAFIFSSRLDRTLNPTCVSSSKLQGNALVPSDNSSTDSLSPLQQRLGKSAADNWKRADILGVLMASYAVLLRSCPSALMSPRAGPVASPGRIDVRKAWRECIDAPTELKSFSFARLSLLPALQMPSHAFETKFEISEFLLSVLSEFAASYLEAVSASGNRPISRAKWEQDAESQLKYRRETAEQQRAFNQWSGTSNGNQEVVPDSVDLLKRPDCMDDVFAFASAVCSLGSEYALSFWSKEEISTAGGTALKLIPSRALRDLKEQQSSDDTLRHSYLSFLSVLALATSEDGSLNGAKAIYDMIAEEEQADGTRGAVTWSLVFETIRYYARELSQQDFGSTSSTASTTGTSSGSTAYYYFASDSPATTQTTTKESTSRTKRELGEESTFSLLAHLNLICNVASKSAMARSSILSVHLPVESPNGREVVGQDSALMVLFNLSVTALVPDVRGKVFETAAALLKLDDTTKEQSLHIRQCALKGWELLEAYLVLPIHLLEQFSSVQLTDIQNVPGLAFPPSSTSIVSTDGDYVCRHASTFGLSVFNKVTAFLQVSSKADKSWLPADPRFSIIYEMEHVESALGVYKSTGGFLSLLKSLVSAGGCPSRLGSNWRVRAGCTPYVEYVVDLVIPRATGKFGNCPSLPFRTDQDKNSLVGLALELVEIVVSSYIVPSPELKGKLLNDCYKKSLECAKRKLGHEDLANAVVTEPPFSGGDLYPDLGAIEVAKTTDDSSPFAPKSTLAPSAFANNSNPTHRAVDIPPGMSPGFTVLAEALSSESTLLDSLLEALRSAVLATKDCIGSDNFALAQSLYVTTQPSFSSAKKASRSSSIELLPRQATLEALQPVPSLPTHTKLVECKERSILSVLRILCAVVAREEVCRSTLKQASTPMALVPFLRFQAKSHTASQLKVLVLNFAHLSEQITTADTQTSVVSQLIDCASVRTFQSADIASAAAALIFSVGEELGPQKGLNLFCRRHKARSYHLARAFGDTLLRCPIYYSSGPALDLTKLILEKILTELRNPSRSGDSFVLAMLGLPSETFESGLWHIGSTQVESPRDCFDAILRLIHKDEIGCAGMKPELVSLCYEVIYRLNCLESLDSMNLFRVDYVSKHLRSLDFWKLHVSSAIPLVEEVQQRHSLDATHFLHSLAWILKGVAEEFRLQSSHANPQPESFQSLLRVLVDPDRIQQLVSAIPMERISSAAAVVPPEESIRCSKYKISGAPGVVTGYELVDARRLCAHANVHDAEIEAGYLAWADRWNSAVMRDCAASHLTSAIHIAFGSASMAFKEMVPHLSTQAGPWLNILNCLIGRMSNPMGQQPEMASLDEQFFTTATRNLSLAIVVIADFARFSCDHEANTLLPQVSLSIIRLIALSGNGISDGPFSARQTERTANLAGALSILMQGEAPEQFEGFGFLQAGVVISRLAIQKSSLSVPFEPPTHALVSRSCLRLLFRLSANDDDNFCRSILTQAVGRDRAKLVVDGLIDFIPLLDPGISSLLSQIAKGHFGGHLLIERGILEALQEAATKYLSEESKFVSSRSTSVHTVDIGTPSFFQGHLRLLCTLMDSQERDNAVVDKIRVKFCDILSIYSPILQRLTEKFPREGNELAFLTRCIAKLHFSTGRARSHAIAPASAKEMVFSDAFRVAESRIFNITMHIAENPLPRELQRPLPACLAQKVPASSTVVVTAAVTTKTWWDALNIDQSAGAKKELFRFAAFGLAMACDGLCIIRRSHQSFQVVDIPSLLRAICRCGDALKVSLDENYIAGPQMAKSCSYNVSQWAEIESSQSSTNVLFSPSRSADSETPSHSIALRDKASDLLEDLILLVLSRLHQLKSSPFDRRVTGDLQNLILSTLNYLGLNTTVSRRRLANRRKFFMPFSPLSKALTCVFVVVLRSGPSSSHRREQT